MLGITRQTAWRWAKDPRIIEAIRFLVLQNAGSPEKVGQILDMLHAQALATQSGKLAEVWLKATGIMSQFARSSSLLEYVEQEGAEFTDFSLEELEILRAQAEAAQSEDLAVVRAKAALGATKPVAGS